MSIKTRLIFVFAMLLALVASQAFITINRVGAMADIATEIAITNMQRVAYVNYLNNHLFQLRYLEQGLVTAGPEDTNSYLGQMSTTLESIKKDIRQYSGAIDDTDTRALFDKFIVAYGQYSGSYLGSLLENVTAGDKANAIATFVGSQKIFEDLEGGVTNLRYAEYARAVRTSQRGMEIASRTSALLGFAIAVVAAIEMGLGWYIWRSIFSGLGGLMAATKRVSRGDLSVPVKVTSDDEFADLARSFNAMMVSMRVSQAENARLHDQALQLREEHIKLLQEQLTRIVKAQEDERQRIARELHDQTGQDLTALQFGLGRLEEKADSESTKAEIGELRSLTVETMQELRRLALDLRPSLLDELGLVPALRQYIREYSKRVNLPIELEISGLKERLPPEMETALFRVVQEGLSNIAKHASATQAAVSLKLEDSRLKVRVEDNGKGFDVSRTMQDQGRKSLGLFGIQERISLLGGVLQIDSRVGKGTRLMVEVPLAAQVASG